MADTVEQLNDLFAIPGHATIPPDILGELQSIERLHSISSQELYYKWEYYSIKMGSEETKLDLSTVRAFKKDVQETLERETRGRANVRSTDKRGLHATPRGAASSDDIFGMWVCYLSHVVYANWVRLDGLTPNTPRTANGTSKRKVAFETPSVPKVSKATGKSSPTDGRTPTAQANAASYVFGASMIYSY
jgi:DNA polymerase alpha subunit B